LKCLRIKSNDKVRPRTDQEGPRGKLGTALLFNFRGRLAPRPDRFTPGNDTRYPLYSWLAVTHGWSVRVKEVSSATGIRPPNRPARSESLYTSKLNAILNRAFLKLL
jgi:hypothetical protein